MYIELNRTFRELLRDKKKGDRTGALTPGSGALTLPELLSERRVVILSEAGSGKTEEIREAARRLHTNGKAAFFLRLEHVVVDFDSAFEEGTLEDFQCWLASSEQGWILLDSIDESRLRSPQEFEAAMRILGKKLEAAKQRTHIVITGRAPAWRPKTDLELCAKLFPVANENYEIAENKDTSAAEKRTYTPGGKDAKSFKVVTLEDLSSHQIKQFAKSRGINDIQAFLDSIERADAWSFTARPQDLEELTEFWLDNETIGLKWTHPSRQFLPEFKLVS